MFNLAYILRRLAKSVLEDEKSTLNTVLQAVHELKLSQKYFQFLAKNEERIKVLSESEAKKCEDLLPQAQLHVERAKRIDEEEKMLRKKQEQER